MKIPEVSVIMSVYNCQKYLKQAIQSILDQTYQDIEFLIMDDGSTDNSKNIIDRYADIDKRIKLFRQNNCGLSKSLNELIQHARGKYIARMDADDVSEYGRLAKQVNYLENNEKCGVVGCGFIQIDSEGMICRGLIRRDNKQELKNVLQIAHNVPFAHGSVVLRKSVLTGLDHIYRFKYGQDFDLWLRLSKLCEFGTIEEILYRYRIHNEAIQSHSVIREKRLMQSQLLIEMMNQGKIFEFDLCKAKVDAIWEKESMRLFKEKKQILSDCNIRVFLVSGNFQKMREIVYSKLKKKWEILYLLLILISFLPVNIAHRILDIGVRVNNCRRKTNMLTFQTLHKLTKSI